MRTGLGLGLALVILLSPQPASAEKLNPTAGKISAKYILKLNGLKMGKAFFNSKVSDRKYVLKGFVKLSSSIKWILKWSGSAVSTGTMSEIGPKPTKFKYSFSSKRKSKTMDLKFLPNSKNKFKVRPPLKTRKRIPVKPEHIVDVLDPLSGLIVLSTPRRTMPDPKICAQRIRVFDGKERFDIVLTFKKVSKLALSGKNSSYSGRAYVCGAKYIAISGHKTDDELASFLKQEKDIEVWLVPELRANVYVPAYIRIPTPLGIATAKSEMFEINPQGESRVTFIN